MPCLSATSGYRHVALSPGLYSELVRLSVLFLAEKARRYSPRATRWAICEPLLRPPSPLPSPLAALNRVRPSSQRAFLYPGGRSRTWHGRALIPFPQSALGLASLSQTFACPSKETERQERGAFVAPGTQGRGTHAVTEPVRAAGSALRPAGGLDPRGGARFLGACRSGSCSCGNFPTTAPAVRDSCLETSVPRHCVGGAVARLRSSAAVFPLLAGHTDPTR